MKETKLEASLKQEHGRGASRRLRKSGQVPAIIYGSGGEAISISLNHNNIYHALKREDFHTSILKLDVAGKTEKVLLRDFQVHAYRQEILHLDFQRVNETEEVQIRIPLHFINEESCYAVKLQNAHVTRIVNEVEIRAFAKDIPHFLEVDLQDLKAGQSLHLSSLTPPKGVTLVNLLRGDDAVIAIAAGIVEEVEEAIPEMVSAADVPTVDGKKPEEE